MTKDRSIKLALAVTAEQLDTIDAFRSAERLASRAAALELLMEIALDTISDGGRRFWDKPISNPDSEPPA